MKEDKRIGVQGEGSKTPEADVENQTPFLEGASRDDLVARITELDGLSEHRADLLDQLSARLDATEDALREANSQIELRKEAHRRAVLDYFDLVSKLPQDANGAYVTLDDIVEWQGERWQVVAISHKRKVVIRRESATDGKGGRWLDDTSQVTLADHEPQTHEAIESRLLEAGYVPALWRECPDLTPEGIMTPINARAISSGTLPETIVCGEDAPDSTLWEDAEFWKQQYGKSKMELMGVTSEYSDALETIDSLRAQAEDLRAKLAEASNALESAKARIADLEKCNQLGEMLQGMHEGKLTKALEERDSARDIAVGLVNEAARLKSEVADLGASLHAAESKADRAISAWDVVTSRAEGVMQLLASVASPMEYPAKNAIAILVEVLKDGVDASRKIVGARDAFDFAHKEADHGQA